MSSYPTVPDLTIKVGDIVKSFDFPHIVDYFIIGQVMKISNGAYVIDAVSAVSDGQAKPLSPVRQVFVPVNGSIGIMGKTTGVVRI